MASLLIKCGRKLATAVKLPPPPFAAAPGRAIFLRHFTKPHGETAIREEALKTHLMRFTNILIEDMEKRGACINPEMHSIVKQCMEHHFKNENVQELLGQLYKMERKNIQEIEEKMRTMELITTLRIWCTSRGLDAVDSEDLVKRLRDLSSKPRAVAGYHAMNYALLTACLAFCAATVHWIWSVAKIEKTVETEKTPVEDKSGSQHREEVQKVAEKDVSPRPTPTP